MRDYLIGIAIATAGLLWIFLAAIIYNFAANL